MKNSLENSLPHILIGSEEIVNDFATPNVAVAFFPPSVTEKTRVSIFTLR